MHGQTTAPQHAVAFTLCLFASLAFAHGAHLSAQAQTGDVERERAMKIWEASNFVGAVPLLEKVAKAHPTDIAVLSRLGFAIYATSASITDAAARQAMREHARQILLQSQKAGDDSNLTRITLDALSSNDKTAVPFSDIRDAEKAIREGEEAFTRGDLDKALAAYQQALRLDPKLYEAALYTGDMYFKKGHAASNEQAKDALMDKAGEWFARAVAINENRETAHRYWGDALMMGQNKKEESRLKFVEAVVAEPYTRTSWVGLMQWGQNYGVTLAHPRIEPPQSASNVSEGSLWPAYISARVEWRAKRFADAFPAEKIYRHSLSEEAAALRAVAEAASKQAWGGKASELSPALRSLIELNKDGLLEAYILLATPDEGIARDYEAYRRANRDKLRRYLLEYVTSNKN
ncbi:MAG: tetratricopeptide repeat protein [Acidobacteria bacterium]|nr:tetratricopeptide repeat protein [Acidobacteriota bacterium]